MAQLVLKPSLADFSPEEVRDWLEPLRIRRMSAALEYHNAINAKVGKKQEKVQAAFTRKIAQLERILTRMDADDQKLGEILLDIDMLKQEMGLLTEQLHVSTEDQDDDV